jgi:hypothetical protein
MLKKIFFTTFTLWLTIFFTCKNSRIARKNFFQANLVHWPVTNIKEKKIQSCDFWFIFKKFRSYFYIKIIFIIQLRLVITSLVERSWTFMNVPRNSPFRNVHNLSGLFHFFPFLSIFFIFFHFFSYFFKFFREILKY